jgi:hypothetical protein
LVSAIVNLEKTFIIGHTLYTVRCTLGDKDYGFTWGCLFFAYGFEFAEIYDSEMTKIDFHGLTETPEADFFC